MFDKLTLGVTYDLLSVLNLSYDIISYITKHSMVVITEKLHHGNRKGAKLNVKLN